MTGDTAANYVELGWLTDERIEVAFGDDYNCNFCSRADRKANIESALSSVAGRAVSVEFKVSKTAAKKRVAQRATKLTRVQQIRELQEVPFVKEAIALFEGEIAGYFNPHDRD